MLIGEEIKNLREAKGLSQAGLAEQAGVNQSFISMLERGDRPGLGGAEVLFKICRALSVPCEHFAPFLLGDLGSEVPAASAPKVGRGRPKKPGGTAAGATEKPKQ